MVVEGLMEVDTEAGMTAEAEEGMGAGQVVEEAGATEEDMAVEQRAERSKTCRAGGERAKRRLLSYKHRHYSTYMS